MRLSFSRRTLGILSIGAFGLCASCREDTHNLDLGSGPVDAVDGSGSTLRRTLLSSFVANGPLVHVQSTGTSRRPLIGTHRANDEGTSTTLILMKSRGSETPRYIWLRMDSFCGQIDGASGGSWDLLNGEVQLYPADADRAVPELASARIQLIDGALVLTRGNASTVMDYDPDTSEALAPDGESED